MMLQQQSRDQGVMCITIDASLVAAVISIDTLALSSIESTSTKFSPNMERIFFK